MKNWWLNLNLREKQILTIACILLSLALFYWIVWQPLANTVSSLRSAIAENKKLAAWMQNTDAKILQAEKNTGHAKVAFQGSLLSLTQKNLSSSGLGADLTELKQTERDRVFIYFKQVAFDKFIQWLMQFTEIHALTVTKLTIKATNSEGIVTAQLEIV